MAKPCLGWGVLSQPVLDLPGAHQHYCNEHDPERCGAPGREGSLGPAPHPALGGLAVLSPRRWESSSGALGSSTPPKMPVTDVEQLFILP